MLDRFGARFAELDAEEDDDSADDLPQVPANVYEDVEGVTFELELPGVSPSGLEVRVQGDSLVVEAERPFHRTRNKTVRRLEGRFGRMRRQLPLPWKGEVERAQAELRHGILRIFVPRPLLAESTTPLKFDASDEGRPVELN